MTMGWPGITSNPTIFRKAISSGGDYDASLNSALAKSDCDAMELYEHVAIEDIRTAADVLLPVFRSTGGADGFVSLEVSPYIALDTERTIAEARRLWAEVARPNIMIKVPATDEGVPAIRKLLGEGININITLLFGRPVYRQVAEAYIAALEQFTGSGGDPHRLASVASFFVSRIDTAVDKRIEEKLKQNPGNSELAQLRGQIAIANAKLAYQDYKQLFSGARWEKLKQRGARVQRLLWASTSTKNPAYRDVVYVEELIGPDTINTMPQETLEAFRDHGRVAQTIEQGVPDAQRMVEALERGGISLEEVTKRLTSDGVQLFAELFDDLLAGVEQRRVQALGPALNRYSEKLDKDTGAAVEATRSEWRKSGKIRRLWRADAALWTGTDEGKWLGWLTAVDDSTMQLQEINAVADELRNAGNDQRCIAGHGRFQPWRGSVCKNLRQTEGLARFACAGFNRSRRNHGPRKFDRSGANCVHCLQQIGNDARAEHPDGLFLVAHRGGAARAKQPHNLSPSLIPVQSSPARRKAAVSVTFFWAIRKSAAGIPCCRCSGWFPRR